MRQILITVSFLASITYNAVAQKNIILLKNISSHIGETVTILSQPVDFDSRGKYWYLYFGDRFPKQLLAIMVEKSGIKPIKLDNDLLLGRKMVEFTGKLLNFEGEPDSSINPETKKIKREVERHKDFVIGGNSMRAHFDYVPHTEPINLKSKLVIIITDRDQIGRRQYPVVLSLY